MTAHLETSPPAVAPLAPATSAAVYIRGSVAGLLGAAVLAIWFFALDLSRGHALYTPTLLGSLLFRSGDTATGRDVLAPSIPLTLLFTVVHAALFAAMGAVAARLLVMVSTHPRWLSTLVVFVVLLNLGFAAWAMTFAAVAVDALDWPDVALGNLWAALAMTGYLLRHRPPATP